MLIEVIFQVIFIILSIMCFKSDDNFDFNISSNQLSKAANLYEVFNMIGNNYPVIDQYMIEIYNTVCEYLYSIGEYIIKLIDSENIITNENIEKISL
jgi:hypothetical protein